MPRFVASSLVVALLACSQPVLAQADSSGVALEQEPTASSYTASNAHLAAAVEVESWASELAEVPSLSVSLTGLPVLSPGARSEHVITLRSALVERGFLSPPSVDPNFEHASVSDPLLYDAEVEAAVRAAQQFYGLVEDGISGPQVFLNLTGADSTLGTDLAAWGQELRWHAEQARLAGHRKMIVVNLPSYTLKAIDLTTGETIVETRVIVGKPSGRTPIFTTNITNLKYNPDWTPPPSLARQGKRYVGPGPNNPMGRVRFSTNNNIHIFLHHTNEPGLFERPGRALSAGCVRVERWEDLASFVSDESVEHVLSRVDTGKTVFDKVEEVPVVMSYSLVDVTAGRPARFPDVYRVGARASAPDHLK